MRCLSASSLIHSASSKIADRFALHGISISKSVSKAWISNAQNILNLFLSRSRDVGTGDAIPGKFQLNVTNLGGRLGDIVDLIDVAVFYNGILRVGLPFLVSILYITNIFSC